MLVLSIETSTPQTSVALGSEKGVLGEVLLSWGDRGHAEVVTPALERLLAWTETTPGSIGGIAAGLGPGLFTGLRVGITTARALSQVLRVPMVGIGSLDVLAFAVRHIRRRIGAVIDARRGEVFWAFYRPVPGGVARETPFTVGPAESLAAELEATGEETLLVGDGALRYRRDLEEVGPGVEMASMSTALPGAVPLLELSLPRFLREETSRPDEVVPFYVRRSDAEIGRSRAARGA